MSTGRRITVGLVLSVASLLAMRGAIYAHAMLVSSAPAANSVVAASPRQIRLVFSEQIEPTLATISVVSSDGQVTPLRVAGDPHDVDAIVAPVAALATGAYRVAWHVVSADGHPVGGTFVFWVGRKSGAPAPAADQLRAAPTWGPSLLAAPMIPAILRGLAMASAMALAGMLLFLVWFGRDAGGASPTALIRWLAISTPLLLALHFGAWVVNASPEHSLTSNSISAAAASGVGRVELWRLAFAALALWALWLARRPLVSLVFALAVIVLSGATGHSAAIQAMLATPSRSLHLLAGATWIGGILWLLTRDRADAAQFAREASRVSSAALWSMSVVAASGIGMAALFLESPRDLVSSGYGAVLLAKVTGLLVLVGFGAHHRTRILPSLRDDTTIAPRFAIALRREITVMLIVVLLGGWLAFVPPPSDLAHRSSDSSIE